MTPFIGLEIFIGRAGEISLLELLVIGALLWLGWVIVFGKDGE